MLAINEKQSIITVPQYVISSKRASNISSRGRQSRSFNRQAAVSSMNKNVYFVQDYNLQRKPCNGCIIICNLSVAAAFLFQLSFDLICCLLIDSSPTNNGLFDKFQKLQHKLPLSEICLTDSQHIERLLVPFSLNKQRKETQPLFPK